MYKIIKDGEVVGLTEKLRFVRKHDNGCFVEADETDAQGIALNGTVYNLLGWDEMEGVTDTVIYAEVDGAEPIRELAVKYDPMDSAVAGLEEMSVDQEYRLILMELGV